jgi:hypothetical protein
MTTINEILTLDLSEDIKNVIDLEDRAEEEIQQELESYIVTEGIGRHLDSFLNLFTSDIKETGVWLSGFYGSGKSYFGKMLGYILANPVIIGTPARDRFIPRLKGVPDEALIENAIRKLDSVNSRVVFLDVAKQNTDKGLAFTLFINLLKTLGFREDVYGYMEFDLLLDGEYEKFKAKAKELEGRDWDELKKSNKQVAKAMRSAYLAMGYSQEDYNETKNVYEYAINNFSASRFKSELERYLNYQTDEVVVFIFDEASEAISQDKFSLLDLEGISEALSSISSKVWTVAIAQEKLDDVINNANVSRSQLTKVTDRFKTKIHLESTEVDVIIRNRLLQKKDAYFAQLAQYYNANVGLVGDATNLKSSFPTKTISAEEFATYYPFHKYQFEILQKFLFSSNALVATQIAARGMIITTFDVLRKRMRDLELFAFTPGHAICSEAQQAPPVALVSKYDTARKILNETSLGVDGEQLLKTIHLLSDSEIVSPTAGNITKSYITDISTYYEVKPNIEAALKLLEEAKVLLLSNNNYKITSDLEGKLLDEMRDIDVELFAKKRFLISYLKENKFFNPVATFNDGTDSFKFNVLSDQDDELCSPGSKQLKLTVYSLFNISENRQDFIEQVKLETQYSKDLITLIPDNNEFSRLDRLIGDIRRYHYMEEKYSTESDPNIRQIIRDFAIIREEREKELRTKIESAYHSASMVYLFDEYLLNSDTFKGTINDTQRKLVNNIFTKRLSSQLSEGLASKVFSGRKDNLKGYFSGAAFTFFDAHGNFTGENLKVVEEIGNKINAGFVDGRTLESDLSGPPWGYSFGTIVTTLAVLFRAGRLSVKYNGETWFSYEQKAVHEAFTNATKFKSASFKAVTAALTAAQKSQAVQLLLDLEIETHTGRKVDWNINDFDLAGVIRAAADHFLTTLAALNDTVEGFDSLFPTVAGQKSVLQQYAGKVTEANYIEKVENLLAAKDAFSASIQTVLKAQKFIKKNFSRVREFKRFVEAVSAELKKADRADGGIQDAGEEFARLYRQDMVSNYGQLQQQAQTVKDRYFSLLKNAASGMAHQYQVLEGKVDAALHDLNSNYPPALNKHNQSKLASLKQYCAARVISEPEIGFSTTDKTSGYSLSDMLNYIALAPTKENELLLTQTGFIAEAPPVPDPESDTEGSDEFTPPRRIRLQIPGKIMTVRDYKSLLTAQLTALAGAQPDDKIDIDIEIQS